MAQVEVPFTDREFAALENLAKARHLSVQDLIRMEIGNLLPSPPTCSDDEQRRKALAISGRFHSGRSDIAQRHDDYLAEIYGS